MQPPSPLFKYTKRKHAEALALRGEIRLGTLYDYRKVEYHAPMIGDKDEGVKELTEAVDYATGETLSDFARQFIKVAPGTKDVTIRRMDFTQRITDPNCWLFCTSKRLSATVMHSMDSEYDACVRIDYAGLFCRIIANELIRRDLIAGHNNAVVRECVYRARSRPYQEDDGLKPVLLKDPRYAEQEEVRFIFLARDPMAVDHLDLMLPTLARCCHLAEDIPD